MTSRIDDMKDLVGRNKNHVLFLAELSNELREMKERDEESFFNSKTETKEEITAKREVYTRVINLLAEIVPEDYKEKFEKWTSSRNRD